MSASGGRREHGYRMAGKRSGTDPTVVLVGRPNVGKSTLFNRITGTRRAIVTPMAGTTRDVLAQQAEWLDTTFTLVDTGGLFGASLDPLHELVVKHGQRAIQSADVIVFVVDGREGLVSGDQEIARQLRPVGVPVVLAVNKTDVKQAGDQEFYQLGIAAGSQHRRRTRPGHWRSARRGAGSSEGESCVRRARRARWRGQRGGSDSEGEGSGVSGRRERCRRCGGCDVAHAADAADAADAVEVESPEADGLIARTHGGDAVDVDGLDESR